MHRRRLLAAGGLALGTGLAGCTGAGREPLDERPPGNEVDDAIRTAVGEANAAAATLAAAREEATGPADVDVDRGALEDRLEVARARLEEVSDAPAADEFAAELSAAGSYVDAVDGLVTGTVELAGVAGRLDGLESALAAEEYDRAADELSAASDPLAGARGTLEDAAATAEGIDAAALEGYGARVTEVADALDTVSGLAAGADGLVSGYGELLAGRDRLAAGRHAFQSGDFEAAAAECRAAGDRFAAATSAFERGRAESDAALDARYETALCRSGSLEAASDHFAAAGDAAADGDLLTADAERRAGRDDLDAALACG